MKYYIVAGEASGDLHGANLIKEIKKKDTKAEFRVWGGDLMEAESQNLVLHYRHHAVMGLMEVIKRLRRINSNFNFCYSDIQNYQPDVVVLIDYPGFNLRIAKYAKLHGFKVVYYISPKVWAWKKSRVYKIKKYVDRMLTIFPFETDFYKQYDYQVDYVGNPVLDSVEQHRSEALERTNFLKINHLDTKPIIALLAGSRVHEIEMLLPEMIAASREFSNYQFVVAGLSSIDNALYAKLLQNTPIRLIINQTYDLLNNAHSAIVTSGTATLETALFNVPQVVCYKIGKFTYFVASFFVSVRFFSLVNIIANKEVIKELLQRNLSAEMAIELGKIVNNKQHRQQILDGYAEMREKMGAAGASQKAATIVYEVALSAQK